MANAKIQPFTILDQSKHHCYTLSTTCTLFKLASEVGPRTNLASLCCLKISETLYPLAQTLGLLVGASSKFAMCVFVCVFYNRFTIRSFRKINKSAHGNKLQ